jgi:hypothetical protein
MITLKALHDVIQNLPLYTSKMYSNDTPPHLHITHPLIHQPIQVIVDSNGCIFMSRHNGRYLLVTDSTQLMHRLHAIVTVAVDNYIQSVVGSLYTIFEVELRQVYVSELDNHLCIFDIAVQHKDCSFWNKIQPLIIKITLLHTNRMQISVTINNTVVGMQYSNFTDIIELISDVMIYSDFKPKLRSL